MGRGMVIGLDITGLKVLDKEMDLGQVQVVETPVAKDTTMALDLEQAQNLSEPHPVETPLVLLDASFLGHRARSVIKGLSFEGSPTGVIYGVLEEIRALSLHHRIMSNQMLMFFDSKTSHRKKFFPGYKDRDKDMTEEEIQERIQMKEQLERLRSEILPDIGFPVYRQPGLESDDLIAQACIQLRNRGTMRPHTIVSADGDLLQCIVQDIISWYDPIRDKYLDHLGLYKEKGIEPDQWAEVKVIAGCSGDRVPGVPGVGEVTAIKYITGTLNPTYKKYKAIIAKESLPIMERNRLLVVLPHAKTQEIDIQRPNYNPDKFWNWVEKLGFSSLKESRKKPWDIFFAGDLNMTLREAAVARRVG